MLESSFSIEICRQSPFTMISSTVCEISSGLTKHNKKDNKKTILFLIIFMRFLRHYCMDQVQRVSVKISGLLTTPCSWLNDISVFKKNLDKE